MADRLNLKALGLWATTSKPNICKHHHNNFKFLTVHWHSPRRPLVGTAAFSPFIDSRVAAIKLICLPIRITLSNANFKHRYRLLRSFMHRIYAYGVRHERTAKSLHGQEARCVSRYDVFSIIGFGISSYFEAPLVLANFLFLVESNTRNS